MKALLFHKFKNICINQYFVLGIQIVSLFLYIGTLGEKAIQSCEYHIVPRPRTANEGWIKISVLLLDILILFLAQPKKTS